MMSLTGNTLVIGANRGIGLGFIQSLANYKQITNLIATYRNPSTSLELLSLEKKIPALKTTVLDIAEKDHISKIQKTIGQMPIDYLIVNSGIFGEQEHCLDDITYDNLYKVFLANTMGHILLIQSLIKNVLLSNRKVVMSISSISGSIASYATGRSYVYKSSKAALNSLLKNVSLEFKEKGLKVLITHPGWVRTDMGGQNANLSVEESVSGMLEILAKHKDYDTGSFIDYQGNKLNW